MVYFLFVEHKVNILSDVCTKFEEIDNSTSLFFMKFCKKKTSKMNFLAAKNIDIHNKCSFFRYFCLYIVRK